MELSSNELGNRLGTIRAELISRGVTDVLIEYPAYLSITYGEREYHAGYQFDDEINDTGIFEFYDFTDGYQGEVYTLDNPDMLTIDALAEWLANSIAYIASRECPECGERSNDFRGDWCKACDKEGAN